MQTSFLGSGLLCAWVGTVLLVVATATEHWMQYRLAGALAHQGLWRYCLGPKCFLQTEGSGEARALRRGGQELGTVPFSRGFLAQAQGVGRRCYVGETSSPGLLWEQNTGWLTSTFTIMCF